MNGNDFSWLATAFFLAYAVAEIPQGVHNISNSFETVKNTNMRRHTSSEISHHESPRSECLPVGGGFVLFSRCTEFRRDDSLACSAWVARSCHWYVPIHATKATQLINLQNQLLH
jgi:hypothetical protein